MDIYDSFIRDVKLNEIGLSPKRGTLSQYLIEIKRNGEIKENKSTYEYICNGLSIAIVFKNESVSKVILESRFESDLKFFYRQKYLKARGFEEGIPQRLFYRTDEDDFLNRVIYNFLEIKKNV